MNVRNCKWLVLVLTLFAWAGSAAWADGQRPSRQTLEAMGLGGLVVLSDDEAMSIRGQGFGSSAEAWGNSWASVHLDGASAASFNGYQAHGKNHAEGSNFSFAGVQAEYSGGKGGDGGKGGGKKSSKGSRGSHGSDWGNSSKGGDHKSSKGGSSKGGHKSSKGGGHKGGGHKGGGHKGGGHKTKSLKAFAGGWSSAKI